MDIGNLEVFEVAINCKMCGTSNDDNIQFCGACGSPMKGDPGQVRQEAPKSKGLPAKTMMFGVSPVAAKPAPAAVKPAPMAAVAPAPMPAAQQKKALENQRTVMGVPAVVVAPPAGQPGAATPAPMAKPVQAAAAPAPVMSTQEALKAKRTVLGMPAVTGEAAEEAAKQAVAQAQPARQPSAPTTPLEPVAKPAASVPAEPEPDMEAPTACIPQEEKHHPDPDPADEWPDEAESLPRKSGSGLLIVAIIAGVIVAIGAGLLVYLLVFKGSGDLKPQVFPSADGNSLSVVLTFAGAPVGTTVQAQGQTVPVGNGQARFDLPMKQLALGVNSVQVIYTEPQKNPEMHTFTVVLRHTVSTDLSGLATAQPFFLLNFQVAPGIQLAIGGRPVQTVNGVFAHQIPLSHVQVADAETGDSLIHRVSFQLTDADGSIEQGQQVVTIPVTSLRLDRPADKAVVAMESVTCSGSAEEGATVTVNEEVVGVTAAGFNSTVSLAAIGEHFITVVARAPGKAPRTRTVKVTRIQSLDKAIDEWSSDLDKGLNYPTLARDPNVYAGKKVNFRGRVVNISTEEGVTAFLLYVGEGCPVGAKCAVYVAFRGETDAGLQSMVSVYGIVRGTWDVDLQGGRKETMPALDADFVLRTDNKKSRKRKKR